MILGIIIGYLAFQLHGVLYWAYAKFHLAIALMVAIAVITAIILLHDGLHNVGD